MGCIEPVLPPSSVPVPSGEVARARRFLAAACPAAVLAEVVAAVEPGNAGGVTVLGIAAVVAVEGVAAVVGFGASARVSRPCPNWPANDPSMSGMMAGTDGNCQ